MYKNGILSIDQSTWQAGIATSPYSGVGDMRNLDPHSKPGALLCGLKSTLETPTNFFDSFPKHAAFNEKTGKLYIGTEDGKLYSRTSGGTWNAEVDVLENNWADADKCNGMMFWKGHLLFAETDTIHAWIIDTDWRTDWEIFEEGTRDLIALPHTMFVDEEDVVYVCDGRNIASIQEVFGETFNPSDPATYTWNPTALDLPDGYVATTLTDLGTFLVIGAKYGAATNRGNRAFMFPWDRISASFNSPMRAKGNGVWQSITQDNEIFAVLDKRNAKLYASNLTSYDLIRELRTLEGENRLYPDAIEVVDDEVLYGVGSSTSGVTGCGVYGYKNGLNHIRHTVSAGDTRIEIGSITDIGDGKTIITWTDGTNHGADIVEAVRATGYSARLDSPLFIVGNPNDKKQFSNFDIFLGRDLTTGQGIRLSYRESLDDTWETIGTYDFSTHGPVSKISSSANMTDLSSVQIRIELTTAADSETSPELIGITFR